MPESIHKQGFCWLQSGNNRAILDKNWMIFIRTVRFEGLRRKPPLCKGRWVAARRLGGAVTIPQSKIEDF